MEIRMTPLLKSDLTHLATNLECFNNATIGQFMRDVLKREIKQKEISNKKRKEK